MYILVNTRNKNRRTNLLHLRKSLHMQYGHYNTDYFCIFAIFMYWVISIILFVKKEYPSCDPLQKKIFFILDISESIPIVCSTSIFWRINREQVKPILWQSDNICCILINTMCVISFESSIWAMSIIDWINSYENRCSKKFGR